MIDASKVEGVLLAGDAEWYGVGRGGLTFNTYEFCHRRYPDGTPETQLISAGDGFTFKDLATGRDDRWPAALHSGGPGQ